MAESILPDLSPEDETSDSGDKSRREALVVLGKHAAYTAPAVLAICRSPRNGLPPSPFNGRHGNGSNCRSRDKGSAGTALLLRHRAGIGHEW